MAGRAVATAACTIAWIWSCNVAAVMVTVDAAPAIAGARVPVTVGGTVDATVTARGGVEWDEAEANVVADTSAPEEVRDITRRYGLDREPGKEK